MQIIALMVFCLIFGPLFILVHLLCKRRGWVVKGLISFAGTIAVIGLAICIFSPKQIDYSDPELAPLWRAVEAVDRTSIGFTPVSKDSKIAIERSWGEKYDLMRRKYDVMLHIENRTSRTIAFRKKGNDFVWMGEQESFKGPKKYSTVDGTFNERIVLTYEKERVDESATGVPINVLHISYDGEDPRLGINRRDLTLADVRPILKEWGC